MKLTAIILSSVEEQRAAGDRDIIDPAGVELPAPGTTIPLFRDFSHRLPVDVLGTVLAVRLEDGRLVADVEVTGWDIGIGGTMKQLHGGVIEQLDLMEVSVFRVPSDFRPRRGE